MHFYFGQMFPELHKYVTSVITVNAEVHRPSVDGWKSSYLAHWLNSAHILHNLPKSLLLATDDLLYALISFSYTICVITWNKPVIWQYRSQSSSLHNSFSRIFSSQHSYERFWNVLKSCSHSFMMNQFTLQRKITVIIITSYNMSSFHLTVKELQLYIGSM